MRIALITGASSGLGAEFARQIDEKEKGFDEIWLIARREDRLKELAIRLHHPARPVPMDLTVEKNFAVLTDLLHEADAEVGVLVNAAGFGKIGTYETVNREESLRMIDLNCKAAVGVTMVCLPFMQKGDRILEICSTAAFQPFQHLNVYAASKSFLYNYSRALRTELIPRRINVTAVCPYWVKDTEFIGKARDNVNHTDTKKDINHFPLASKTKSVVSISLGVSRAYLPVVTPGIVCTVHRIFAKIIPRELMMGIWALLRRI